MFAGRATSSGSADMPHWGALLFTLAAGAAVFTLVLAPLLGRAPAPIAREAEPTPTPTAAPTASAPVVAPTADQLEAEVVEITAPAEIAFGSTASITVSFKNTGTARWLKGTPAEVRLGITGDDGRLAELGMAVEWPSATRPAVQEQIVVEPGQAARFTFRLRGAARGVYEVRLQPVVEGVAWMEAQARARIAVR